MGKKTVTPDLAGEAFGISNLSVKRKPKQPPIRHVKPLGGQVLVEIYTEEEVSGSQLFLPDNAKNKGGLGVGGAPQGRVLDIGPGLSSEFGVKIGDRVLLQGSFVPLPKIMDNRDGDRERALVEPHTIKAVLIEEKGESLLGE
jgi:co-chaperonin GroES (HSP10)